MTTTGTRVQHTTTGRVGTVEDTYADYYGAEWLTVRWDNAKRRSNVAAENVTEVQA